MIQVVAMITTQPGKRQEILNLYHGGLEKVRAEPGCIEFTVAIDAQKVGSMHTQAKFGPDTFITIEKWESLKHLEDHSNQASSEGYHENVVPLLKDRVVYFVESSE